MVQRRRWRGSFALLMAAATTALISIDAVEADSANAQTRRTHPRRQPPSPAPAPAPAPHPAPGSVPAADPGVRGGTVDAGEIVANVVAGQGYDAFFDAAADTFADIQSVQGTIPGEPDAGLGPRFNSNGCGTCHSQPALGGTSPSTRHFPFIGPNPQVALATLHGATNRVPFFIRADGPVRGARFKFVVRNGFLTGTPDGGVHQLFTIQGRSDATNTVGITGNPQTCVLAQPDFDQARRQNNVSFRIPTPTYGLGLIESIAEATILANMQAHANAKAALGISGRPNRNGNDGTISRFGWKAQNPSLLVFAMEAYNVEQGVTNEGFPFERNNPGDGALPTQCLFNSTSEDPTTAGQPSDVALFAAFMRLLAPPTPSATSPGGAASIQRGSDLFRSVGCALCHTPALATSPSALITGTPDARLYSDLLLHDMGAALADGVSQGAATGSEFRTAPLWGVGQRIFFLHDGRSDDLLETIQWHGGHGSEARAVTGRFFGLSEADKQNVLNFLRSL